MFRRLLPYALTAGLALQNLYADPKKPVLKMDRITFVNPAEKPIGWNTTVLNYECISKIVGAGPGMSDKNGAEYEFRPTSVILFEHEMQQRIPGGDIADNHEVDRVNEVARLRKTGLHHGYRKQTSCATIYYQAADRLRRGHPRSPADDRYSYAETLSTINENEIDRLWDRKSALHEAIQYINKSVEEPEDFVAPMEAQIEQINKTIQAYRSRDLSREPTTIMGSLMETIRTDAYRESQREDFGSSKGPWTFVDVHHVLENIHRAAEIELLIRANTEMDIRTAITESEEYAGAISNMLESYIAVARKHSTVNDFIGERNPDEEDHLDGILKSSWDSLYAIINDDQFVPSALQEGGLDMEDLSPGVAWELRRIQQVAYDTEIYLSVREIANFSPDSQGFANELARVSELKQLGERQGLDLTRMRTLETLARRD